MSQSNLNAFPRSITQHIIDASAQFPVVLVVVAQSSALTQSVEAISLSLFV